LRRDSQSHDIGEDYLNEEPKRKYPNLKIETGKYRMNAIIRVIETLKAKGITPEKVTPTNEWQKTCLEVYNVYQHHLKESNILDYDDLIIYATKLLEEYRDLRNFYQTLFEYIFVDELQDINLAQYRFISLLVKDKFFFTGDEDQAIYGWRGASKELIYRVAKEFEGVKIFQLNHSFRLPQSILEVANNLMLRQTTAIPNLDTGEVIFYAADSPQDEIDYIVKEVKELTDGDLSYRDIAILYRLNYLAKAYEEGLTEAGIPFSTIRGMTLCEKEEFRSIIEYLEFLTHCDPNGPIENNLSNAIAVLRLKKRLQKKAEKVVEYHILHSSVLSVYKILNEILQFFEMKPESFEEFLLFARNYSDSNIKKFLSDLKLYQEMDLTNWTKDTVKLMTVHSAKGMEFPVVFIVDLVEEIFPITKSLSGSNELEEERRLCYVAITRAQRRLYLLYPKSRNRRQQLPSRFLVDMLRKKKDG
jgi:DNA helicase-2/ATP-dependent DNA helicase PcrA